MDDGQKQRHAKFSRTIGSPLRASGTIDSNQPEEQDRSHVRSGSKKYMRTQSRYKDLKRSSHSNCHRHAHTEDQLDDSIGNKLASYAPLRSNGGNVVQSELDKIPNPREELSPIRGSPEK